MMKIKMLIAVLLVAIAASAQSSDPGKAQWTKEMREYKHAFLAKELDLSAQQQTKFFKVYDKMDDELMQVNDETRRLEKRIDDASADDVTDLELDMATDAIFNLKAKESEIELRYLPELRDVLTKQQLFNLKKAERKFTMSMMRRHHDLRNSKSTTKRGK